MNLEVLIYAEVGVHLKDFVAQWALKHFFGDFLMVRTVMGFDRVVVATECYGAVFAVDGQPVFLFAGVDRAVFSDVLVEHEICEVFKNFNNKQMEVIDNL